MKLKQALLNCLLTNQLKDICAEIEVEADRRSQEAMVVALARTKFGNRPRVTGSMCSCKSRGGRR
jgi:hypothetical protein